MPWAVVLQIEKYLSNSISTANKRVRASSCQSEWLDGAVTIMCERVIQSAAQFVTRKTCARDEIVNHEKKIDSVHAPRRACTRLLCVPTACLFSKRCMSYLARTHD